MFLESGIVVLNKPCGISSNTAVNRVKKALGAKKCGHLGTLDLEAEGVLLVTVNNATKLFDSFLKSEKTYVAEFEFGRETDTLDASGIVTREQNCDVSLEALEKVCAKMIGKQLQMPPQFSAKKVGGKVAYAEARAGRRLELHPKEIEIFDFKVLGKVEKNVFRVEISCSSGTYIRAIARDCAEQLGTVGHMRSLLRTRCGSFTLENSTNFDDPKKGFVTAENLFDLKKISLDSETAGRLLNGQKIPNSCVDGEYKIYDESAFLGLGEVKNGALRLSIRLN